MQIPLNSVLVILSPRQAHGSQDKTDEGPKKTKMSQITCHVRVDLTVDGTLGAMLTFSFLW